LKPFLKALVVNAASLTAQAVSLALAPVAALRVKNGKLLPPFTWMGTPDTSLTDFGGEKQLLKIQEKYGSYAARVWWLWRNKAYGARFKLATKDLDNISRKEKGPFILYSNGKAFDFFFIILETSKFRLYFRFGWKIKPYFDGYRPSGPTAVGMPELAFRTDDAYE